VETLISFDGSILQERSLAKLGNIFHQEVSTDKLLQLFTICYYNIYYL